jgi:hypothetical protein
LFQQAVPPQLVRRTYGRDVFVTNLRVLGDDTFEVSARWPGEHVFYGPVRGRHDPLLFLESMREAILLVAHFAFQVPREYKFITHDKQFDIDPTGLRADCAEPVDVVFRLTAHDIKRRGHKLAGMRMEAECVRDGVRIGGGAYRWSCVTPAVYKRLRGDYVTAEPAEVTDRELIPPRLIGRTHDVDVMLAGSADESSWDLRQDPAHPVVYDHTVDHVPGNGCIEAARQAALLALGCSAAMVVRGDFTFFRYLEFDTPCVVSASRVGGTPDGPHTVQVVFEQNDGRSIEGTFDLVVDD